MPPFECPPGHGPADQQPRESEQAYEAFVLYRDLAGARSQETVAVQLDKSRSLISRWSTKHHWLDRVRAIEHEGSIEDLEPTLAYLTALESELTETIRLQLATQRQLCAALIARLSDPEARDGLKTETLARLHNQISRDLALAPDIHRSCAQGALRGLESHFSSMSDENLIAFLQPICHPASEDQPQAR